MRAEITTHVAQALRYPHTAVVRLEVWRNGQRLDTVPFPNGLPVLDGEVTNDGAAQVRRQIDVTVPATDNAWRLMSAPGTELHPYRGIQWPNGSYTWVPLGRMEVDEGRIGYTPSGNLRVTGGDYWGRVMRSQFITPGIANFGTLISAQMVTFLQQALPATVGIQNTLASTYVIGDKVYQTDRAAAIEEMATALSAEVIFDGDGNAVLRAIPQVQTTPVWTVDAGATGVLLSADRDAINHDIRNVVVVVPSTVTGTTPLFDPVWAWDNDPNSATYAGPDPARNPSGAGPFGVRPYRIDSAAITDAGQAQNVATAYLALVSGQRSTLTLTSLVHPGLEYGDTIAVVLPADVTGARQVEAQLVESVTIPLTVSAAQRITTRTRGGLALS